jgi:nitrogen-specific signal transduction histidine kinase/ActR/RegA family two-component response regulator
MQAEAKRTLLEAQLRESQKMESIGTLAGGIAHDFNNILAVILGNVAAARHDATLGQDPLHSLAQIDKAAIRARSLVQQILAFSRMQPHVLVIQPLRPLVEESVTLLRSTLPAQVEFDIELARTPLYVGADATQVQQVLMNLLTNAWHSLNGSRGRISIGLEAVVLDLEATQALAGVQPGNYAHLWVRDTGSGMDESTRVRVFEPFFTTKPVGQGTGLGLSVVHGIVAAHKGAVTVDSVLGQGSTFHLYLPLTDHGPFVVPTAPAPLELMQGQGQHVLCVDDDPAMLIMVEGLLQRSGYRVTAIESPREALAAMRAQPNAFDVIVTDFNMPELTGIDFAHEVLRMMPAVPVVITSGYISEELRAAASRVGVRRLLEKEYTLEQLASVVHSALVDTQD